MQIQLRQPEIVKALEQFISSQGINLTGKLVDIRFTAGRKNSGLSADILIADAPEVSSIPSIIEAVKSVVESATVMKESEYAEEPETPKATSSLFS